MIYRGMRHIHIYESFSDDIDPSAREIFGLTSSFIVNYPAGMSVTYTGPSEEEAEARKIVDVERVADDVVDALEEIGWQEECEFRLYEPRYSFKGSFRNWKGANRLVGNLKTSARYRALEKMQEDPDAGDEDKKEYYEEHIHEVLADPATVQKFREIGFTIYNLY